MNRTFKTVVTVVVCTVCVFVSVCCLGYCYYIQKEPIRYEFGSESRVYLKEASLERFDYEGYRDFQKDGYDIYKLHLTVENNGSRQSAGDVLYMYYSATDSYSLISEISRMYFSEDDAVIPPGKKAVINRILYVPKDCNEFKVKYSNYKTNEEQTLMVEVPRA